MFRMATILQSILQRALHGSAAIIYPKPDRLLARPMAEAGWRQVIERQAVG